MNEQTCSKLSYISLILLFQRVNPKYVRIAVSLCIQFKENTNVRGVSRLYIRVVHTSGAVVSVIMFPSSIFSLRAQQQTVDGTFFVLSSQDTNITTSHSLSLSVCLSLASLIVRTLFKS